MVRPSILRLAGLAAAAALFSGAALPALAQTKEDVGAGLLCSTLRYIVY